MDGADSESISRQIVATDEVIEVEKPPTLCDEGLGHERKGEWKDAEKAYLAGLKNGELRAHLLLADMYEQGRGKSEATRNPRYEFSPDARKLFMQLKAFCESDLDPECAYRLATCYIEGRGAVKNYEAALGCLVRAAGHFHTAALKDLSELYLQGIVVPLNIYNAYVFALLARMKDAGAVSGAELMKIEAKLKAARVSVLKIQKETSALSEMEPGQLVLRFGEMCMLESPESPVEESPDHSPGSSGQKAVSDLSHWKLDRLGELKLCYFPAQKQPAIRLEYREQKIVFPVPSPGLFNANILELIRRFHEQELEPKRAIGYYDSDIANAIKTKRSNRQIVCDFNHAIRRLFGLGKEAKAMEWIVFS
ncbi:MAG: hypothetical protein U1B83_09735, partial [Candidatus Cloacimonadaceae bacterium]|nr:hypothetical protein [Candidatus Cloacimonadaceae bacterium]